MSDAPIRVEVELSRDDIIEMMYESDNNPNWPNPCKAAFPAPKGSRTEAMMRLAEAADAYFAQRDALDPVPYGDPTAAPLIRALDKAEDNVTAALAAVREFEK